MKAKGMNRHRSAIIVSSGRVVPVLLDGTEFWVLHRCNSVSGPFLLTDKRFKLERVNDVHTKTN